MHLIPVWERVVPGWGDLDSKICIVGEAPGSVEVRVGEPFRGPAGTLLNECMQSAQLYRHFTYMTNVFNTLVVKSGKTMSVERTIDGAKKRIPVYISGKGFTPDGMYYVDALKKELESCKANVIIAAGEPAMCALTGLFHTTKQRGSVVESTLLPRRKIIPIIHPSAALRQYIWKYLIINDLRKAKAESEFPELRNVDRKFIKRPQFHEVVEYLEVLNKECRPQAVDLEIINHEISVFGVGDHERGIVIPFVDERGHSWDLGQEASIWELIAKYVGNPDKTMIFQNGMFDMYVLLKKYKIMPRGHWEDTMVAMNLLYPDFGKGLDMICSLFTNEPYYKDDFKLWSNAQVEREGKMETLWTYNEKDVAVTYEAWLKLLVELQDRKLYTHYREVMDIFPALLYMEARGLRVDKEELAQAKKLLEKIEQQYELELGRVVAPYYSGDDTFKGINPRSHQQLKSYFYGIRGVKPYLNRKTGNVTLDDMALKRLARGTKARAPMPEAGLIRKIRSAGKLRGTYLEVDLDTDSRLRCSINPAGTKNGRLSTSKTIFGTGTNMQNLPQQFKKFLVTDKDSLFIEIDKAQGEWVLCAYMARDPHMIKVVETGADAHTSTAHLAFGVPIELIKKDNEIVGHETDSHKIRELRHKYLPEILEYDIPSSMSVRQAGKKSNHGLNYDMGYRTFALVNEVSEVEAKKIVYAYHEAYPNIRNVFHAWVQDALANKVLTNVFGKQRLFLDRWGDSLLKDGYAYPAQSGLVGLVNRGIGDIWNDNSTYMKDLEMLMQVHDSILFQHPLSDISRMAHAIIKAGDHLNPVMEWQGKEFQIRNDVTVGFNWAGYHKEDNPTGMMNLKWTDDAEDLTLQLQEAIEVLQNGKKTE